MSLSRRAMLVGVTSALASEARSEERMTHVALLGDSIIDNKAYVAGAPDVADQLRAVAPEEWKVTRLAIDGAVSSGVLTLTRSRHQLIPPNTQCRRHATKRWQ